MKRFEIDNRLNELMIEKVGKNWRVAQRYFSPRLTRTDSLCLIKSLEKRDRVVVRWKDYLEQISTYGEYFSNKTYKGRKGLEKRKLATSG